MTRIVLFFAALSLCFLQHPLYAQKKQEKVPDFTAGDSLPEGAKHDWNLGPTGARGWMYSAKLETTLARQILVTSIVEGSPASRELQVGDVILGVASKRFQFDPRVELGRAISEAESKGRRLVLQIWRAGRQSKVALKLPKLGTYSATAPFDCAKSKRIFELGCERLAERMRTDRRATANPIVRCMNALALLSSGNRRYLPLVREQVEWASKYSDAEGRSLHCWHYGPVNLLLAEYTLATGDQSYLPALNRVTMEIVNGQSLVGSWGHRFAKPDGFLNGYGMMNAPGVPLTLSLVLARKAGINDPSLDEAIEKSVGLIQFYVGKGSIPYGDHHPWLQTHDDNGKNGAAALLFNALEVREAATYFSKMSVASHGAEREMGHTGNFFNMLWAMPGTALSGPQATGAWMKEFGWYFDLARQWDGTFRHQGPPQLKRDSYWDWDASGAFLLAYAQPLRVLYITGKQQDVVPQLDKSQAKALVEDGQDYSHRLKAKAYDGRSMRTLYAGLGSWSPIVRERSAASLASRVQPKQLPNVNEALSKLLTKGTTYQRLGACQAITQLKGKSASTVSALEAMLDVEDLWLRVQAAQALAAIGKPALSTAPKLLEMLAAEDPSSDPRGMQKRYLCFALFDRRGGLLRGALDQVDRDALFAAIRVGLNNEDGRARGTIGSVYQSLSFDELKPLLPAIHQAILEPAPSGNMFADGIRLSGLELLAKHHVQEAIPLCVDLIEIERWGQGNRIKRCLNALTQFGPAASSQIPKLQKIQQTLESRRQNKTTKERIELISQAIQSIRNSTADPKLKKLAEL